MIEIARNLSLREEVDDIALKNAVRSSLKNQSAPQDASLSILLTDDAQIRSLNRDYRGIDAPTDVLSFEVHERDPETGYFYLGELILSTPYADRQARKNGNSLEAELQLLVVHGVLHLLGHDHAVPDEKAKMWQAQNEILAKLGLSGIKIQA